MRVKVRPDRSTKISEMQKSGGDERIEIQTRGQCFKRMRQRETPAAVEASRIGMAFHANLVHESVLPPRGQEEPQLEYEMTRHSGEAFKNAKNESIGFSMASRCSRDAKEACHDRM